MHWQNTPLAIPLVATATVAFVLAFFAWHQRRLPIAMPFAALMLAGGGWTLGYALELSSVDLGAKVLWLKLSYPAIVSVPFFWLILVMNYAGPLKWLAPRYLALLAVVPVLTVLLIWTNEAHGLFWSETHLDTSGPVVALAVTYGGWFWVYALYSNLLMALGSILLLQALIRAPRLYRMQMTVLLIGALIPWTANALTMLDLCPIRHLDLTPFSFIITGLLISWGLFRFQFLDIVPVARDVVIESLEEGVFVLDAQNRIVDLNPAAAGIVRRTPAEVIGQSAARVFGSEPGLAERYHDVLETRTEITVGAGERQRSFELHIAPLHNRGGHVVGRVIVLHDISQRKQVEEELRYLSTHDTLTGLYNRACFEEELARLRREGPFPVSIIMADLTGLKAINDSLGHAAGDDLLRQAAGVLRAAVGDAGLVARIGGDEFAALLPGTDEEAATRLVTRIREGIQAHNATSIGPTLVIALGLATAGRPGRLSGALREADDRMYQDKSASLTLYPPRG